MNIGGFNPNEPYNINVKFTLQEDLVPEIKRVDKDGNVVDVKEQTDTGSSDYIVYAKKNGSQIVYDLNPANGYEEKIKLLFPSEEGYVIRKRTKYTYVAKSVNEEFINRIFKCSAIKYNKDTGRVCEVNFEELDLTGP